MPTVSVTACNRRSSLGRNAFSHRCPVSQVAVKSFKGDANASGGGMGMMNMMLMMSMMGGMGGMGRM